MILLNKYKDKSMNLCAACVFRSLINIPVSVLKEYKPRY